ncbi:MAG: DMT family transporter [bacterium]|nr:DMT family transporter [bacterium]
MPCALWGGTWVAVKLVEGAGVGPLAFAAVRALLAGAALAVAVLAMRRGVRIERHDLPTLAAMAVTSALFFGLTFVGAERLPGGLSSLLANASPLFAVVLAALLEHERVDARAIAGVMLGAAGVAVIALPEMAAGPGDLVAMGVMLLGALALAFNVVAMKRATHLDPYVANAAQMSGAGVLLAVGSLLGGQWRGLPVNGEMVAAALYVGLAATALGYVLWSYALSSLSVARASALLFLVPIFGHVWAWSILREPVVPAEVLGAAIAVVGIALAAGGGDRTVPALATSEAEAK